MTQPVDVNDIKGGEYELLDLRWDKPTSKPGDPVFTFERYERGDKVTLNDADAKRLVLAGSVAKPGELEARRVAALRAQYLNALANLPDDLRRAEEVRGLSLDSISSGSIPPEELTVHTAVGYTPLGEHPRYSNAAHGEGDGGPAPEGTDGEDGLRDDGFTQRVLDDGTTDGATAAAREGRDGQTKTARRGKAQD